MWVTIIQTIVFSIIIIVIIHSFYKHVKDILVPKKTRDLVELQVQKYKDILSELQEKQQNIKEEEPPIEEIDYSTMETDLIQFANSQIASSNEGLLGL